MTELLQKDFGPLLTHLEKQGVKVTATTKGWLLRMPNGDTEMLHKTNSDHRAANNLRAHLKRCGITWPTDVVKKDLPDYITKSKPWPSTLARFTEALGDPLPERVELRELMEKMEPGQKQGGYTTAQKTLYYLGYRPGVKNGQLAMWVLAVDNDYPQITAAKERQNQPAPITDPDEPKKRREFLDTVDSWVLDTIPISDVPVGTLQATMKATGLKMEVRVWRDPENNPAVMIE